MADSLPSLCPELENLLSEGGGLPDVPCHGVRTWWAGPLDVEGLALASVRLALQAATVLGRARGRQPDLSTSAPLVAAAFGSQTHLRIDGRQPEGFAPMSGYFATADGWVRLHANYPHHAQVLRNLFDAVDRDQLARALSSWSADDVEQRVRRAGGIAARLRRPQEWRASDPGRAVDGSPWLRMQHHGRPRPLPPTGELPMDGLRVLDLTRVIAGPVGTRLLAALGADVLRVDPPHLPELLDQHLDTGFGKRSAVADLRDESTRRRIDELLDRADAVVTGYRPQALTRHGLDVTSLRQRHPHLVIVSLSAWGTTGPWGSERGFDSIVQAATGIGHIYGVRDRDGTGRPGALPVQALDHATGYGMAAAVMALLATRAERGAGTAALSLTRTAHTLLDLPAPSGTAVELEPPLLESPSPYGTLRFVPPPVLRDGSPLAYPAVPSVYGEDPLAWTTADPDRLPG